MSGNLVRYDAMCRAIAAAASVDEAKAIRDKAVAMEAYFRQAKNRENERKAERIRLRAERRSGELLRQIEKEKGGRPKRGENRSSPRTGFQTLPDMGISKNQSAHWQRVAEIPEPEFNQAVESKKPTVAVNGVVKKQRRAEQEMALAENTKRASAMLGQVLANVIVADPPWRFEPYSRDTGMDRAADNHYPTMTFEELAALTLPAAKDCVLALWTTAPMLVQSTKLMEAWGFTYRSECIWVKDRIGTGYWFRNKHESLLIGVRGLVPAPAPGEQYPSVIEASVGKHSEKPNHFYEMLEELYPNVVLLEMFARKPRLGWQSWGNEAC